MQNSKSNIYVSAKGKLCIAIDPNGKPRIQYQISGVLEYFGVRDFKYNEDTKK